jgi:hypothetical protein
LSAIKIADKKQSGLQTLRVIKTKQFSLAMEYPSAKSTLYKNLWFLSKQFYGPRRGAIGKQNRITYTSPEGTLTTPTIFVFKK